MAFLLTLLLLILPTDEKLVLWEKSSTKKSENLYELTFKGKIEDKWYVYNSKLEVEGPLPTEITWKKTDGFEIISTLTGLDPKMKHDEIWEGNIHYFEKEAHFTQKIKILKPGTVVTGTLRYQVCINDPEDGRCMNEEEKFSFTF
jgi:hypothetical protein